MANSFTSPPVLVDPARVTAGLTIRAEEMRRLGDMVNYSFVEFIVLATEETYIESSEFLKNPLLDGRARVTDRHSVFCEASPDCLLV